VDELEKQQLMKTIKLPFGNLQQIKNVLPKSNYQGKSKAKETKPVMMPPETKQL